MLNKIIYEGNQIIHHLYWYDGRCIAYKFAVESDLDRHNVAEGGKSQLEFPDL